MISFLVVFFILTASPQTSGGSGWIFYGHRRPSLSSMAKGFMPESERVLAEDKSKSELTKHGDSLS